MNEVNEVVEATEETVVAKRPRKLTKGIEGTVVTITVVDGVKGDMVFDITELNEEIQGKLIPFGAGHKLGDAAAGLAGVEAENAIEKVWEGLMKGDWSVRAPAAPKVKMSDVKNALAGMSDEDAAAARALMAKLGLSI